jgi:hypothetical protein
VSITAQEADDDGSVLNRDLSVEDSGTLDIELVWRWQSVRVQHPGNQKWFTLIVTENGRETAAVRLATALLPHLSDLLLDVSDRVVGDL